MKTIYDHHDAAFSNVSAYVITKGANSVMKINLKFPKDGAGRLYAYAHFYGVPMVRAFAGGYGYDKKSAAVSHAIEKIVQEPDDSGFVGKQWYEIARKAEKEQISELQNAFKNIGGKDWQDVLRDLGYTVLQAV